MERLRQHVDKIDTDMVCAHCCLDHSVPTEKNLHFAAGPVENILLRMRRGCDNVLT